jgi:GMP synthase (glutamine-hydrolysing)
MHFLILSHASFEAVGTIGEWITERRFSQQIVRPYQGEALPSLDGCDAVVVMGGPQNAAQYEDYPYLAAEVEWIKRALAAGIRVLGVCLGAQLLGAACGARAENSPEREMGFYPIELTEPGLQDPVLADMPSCFTAGHWHYQMPGLSEQAKILASSAGCPRQIVRYAPHAMGLQCHLELTEDIVRVFIAKCQKDLAPDRYVQTAEEMLQADFARMRQRLFLILERFFLHPLP